MSMSHHKMYGHTLWTCLSQNIGSKSFKLRRYPLSVKKKPVDFEVTRSKVKVTPKDLRSNLMDIF